MQAARVRDACRRPVDPWSRFGGVGVRKRAKGIGRRSGADGLTGLAQSRTRSVTTSPSWSQPPKAAGLPASRCSTSVQVGTVPEPKTSPGRASHRERHRKSPRRRSSPSPRSSRVPITLSLTNAVTSRSSRPLARYGSSSSAVTRYGPNVMPLSLPLIDRSRAGCPAFEDRGPTSR